MFTKSQPSKRSATQEDVHRVPENGKAGIVGGGIVLMRLAGAGPGRAATRIADSLSQLEEQAGGGYAFGDSVGFVVSLPGRDSFSPDAAWYTVPVGTEGMDFLPGAPVLAAEVRSKNDSLAAGTLVVWEVDTLGENVITVHRALAPDAPTA